MMMFRPHSDRTLERPIADRVAVKRPLVKLAGALCLVKVVVRGGIELRIPIESDHSFRSNPIADSGVSDHLAGAGVS